MSLYHTVITFMKKAASTSQLSCTFDSTSSNSHLKSFIFPDYGSGWNTLQLPSQITVKVSNLKMRIIKLYFPTIFYHVLRAYIQITYSEITSRCILCAIIHVCTGLCMSLHVFSFSTWATRLLQKGKNAKNMLTISWNQYIVFKTCSWSLSS